jgi:hypothetical protein
LIGSHPNLSFRDNPLSSYYNDHLQNILSVGGENFLLFCRKSTFHNIDINISRFPNEL